MVVERAARAFWPAGSLALLAFGLVSLGLYRVVPPMAAMILTGLAGLGVLGLLAHGARRFRWPTRAAALQRLDDSLPHAPITTLLDQQAVGAQDGASRAVWAAHRARLRKRLDGLQPVAPRPALHLHDRYAFGLLACTLALTGLVFGTGLRPGEVAGVVAQSGQTVAAGPAWEGWVEPPSFTGKPTLYLNDLGGETLTVPQGSRVTLRLYGEADSLQVVEDVSGGEAFPLADPMAQSFEIARAGEMRIDGPGGRAWQVLLSPDGLPSVEFNGAMRRRADGELQQPFAGADDYGVVLGRAQIDLNLAAVSRQHGLVANPDPRPEILLDLPMPISGDRASFEELLIENLSEHPWVGLPVQIRLSVDDARGQTGFSDNLATELPGQRFFDPLAKAVIEQRRDLLWARSNGTRVLQILRAVSYKPDDVFREGSAYGAMQQVLRDLAEAAKGDLTPEQQQELADALWDLANLIEFGDLSDAAERLKRAQERLEEAMRNGASDEEIAELMQELRDAMNEYIRQLAQQQQNQQQPGDGTDQPGSGEQEQREITGEQLQELLDEIQRLMEEGRMAEAMQLMERLSQMMENLQVTQNPNGQSTPGQEAMEGLGETLREQQGLSDQAFRDLQEQFNPGAQAGQSGQNEGRNGGEGRGSSHEGQQGEGQGQGGDQPGAQSGDGGQGQPQSLAERQRALRRQLEQQQQNLPGVGGEAGRQARDALDRAGRAMDRAERNLREGDLAGALDDQADAVDALRDGMQNLGEALAEQRQQQQGQQGQQVGQGDPNGRRDPLGREDTGRGGLESDENLLGQGNDPFAQARDLLDEIRRRSAEQERSTEERDYLNRLLDKF
ncbi:ATPase [Actibacterium mucosum KCTC 23349]|uniref:ATPase n=2 Tax=Actibacterium TaxID=1433986 RepID=A0A037ZMP5_9RHOB|nr:ATPase [Actibacterium mucosum KCTC 23349]